MQILFLGTGPTKPIIREKEKRSNSSVLIDGFLIDVTPMFLEQVKDLEINPDEIDSVFLTHAHKDAIGGLEDLDKWIGKKINVYVPEGVNVFRFSKEFKNLNIINLQPYKEIEIGDYNITPFRVIHYEYYPTLGKKFPTYGYRINNVVYAEDMEAIPEKSIKYFKNADTIIADGAMWFGKQIRGHLSVDKTLLLAKKFQPNNLTSSLSSLALNLIPSYAR
jgi:phosphoribosyl 1,2-cyclic phosphodiesterase